METVLAHRQSLSNMGKGRTSTNDDVVAEACLLRDKLTVENGSRLKMQEDIRFLRHQLDAREAKITKIAGECDSLKVRNEQLKKMLTEKDEVIYCHKIEKAQMKDKYDRLLEENISLARDLHLLEKDLGMGAAGGGSLADSFASSSGAPLIASSSFRSTSLRRSSTSAATPTAAALPTKDRFAEMMRDKTTIVTLRRKLRENRAAQMEVRRRAENCIMEAEDQLSAFSAELTEFLHEEGCFAPGDNQADGKAIQAKGEESHESDGNAPAYYNYSEGPMGRYIPLIRRIYMEGAEEEDGTGRDKPMTNAEARAKALVGAPRLISFKNVKALGHCLEGKLFKEFHMALNQKFADEENLKKSFQYSPFGSALSSMNTELQQLARDAKAQSELQVNSLFYIFDELEKRLTVTQKALNNGQGVAAGSRGSGVSVAGALGKLRCKGGNGVPSTSTLLRRDGSLADPRGDFTDEMKAHVQEFNTTMRRILVCVREGAKRVMNLEASAKKEWLRQHHEQLQRKEMGTQMNAEEIPDPKIARLEERVEYLNGRMASITSEHSANLLEHQLQRDKAEVVTKFLQEKLFTLHDGVYDCLHSIFKHRVQWISRLPNNFSGIYAEIKKLGGDSPLFASVQFNTDIGTAVEEDTKLLRQFAHFFVAGESYAAAALNASPMRTQRPPSAMAGTNSSPLLSSRKVNQQQQRINNNITIAVPCNAQPNELCASEPVTPIMDDTMKENGAAFSGSHSGKSTSSYTTAIQKTPVRNASFDSAGFGFVNNAKKGGKVQQVSTAAKLPTNVKVAIATNNNTVNDPQELSRKRKDKITLTKAEKQQKQLSDAMQKLLEVEQKSTFEAGSNNTGAVPSQKTAPLLSLPANTSLQEGAIFAKLSSAPSAACPSLLSGVTAPSPVTDVPCGMPPPVNPPVSDSGSLAALPVIRSRRGSLTIQSREVALESTPTAPLPDALAEGRFSRQSSSNISRSCTDDELQVRSVGTALTAAAHEQPTEAPVAPVDIGLAVVRSLPPSRSTSIDSSSHHKPSSHRPSPLMLDTITSGLTRKVSAPRMTPQRSGQTTPRVGDDTPLTRKVNSAQPSPRRNSASATLTARRTSSTTAAARNTSTAAFAPPVGGSRLQSANSSFASDKDAAQQQESVATPVGSTPTTRRRASTVTCEYERMASWQRRQQEIWQVKREEHARELKRGFENTLVTTPVDTPLGTPTLHAQPTPPQTPNSSSNARGGARPATTNALTAPMRMSSGRIGEHSEATRTSSGTTLTPRTFSGPF